MSTKAKLADSQIRYQAERRQLLMDAAAKVIARQGIHATTMEDISASMGMTKIVLYRTFRTKDELIHAILERVTNEFLKVDALKIEKYGDRLQRYLDISRSYDDAIRILLLQTPHDAKYNRQYRRLSKQLVKRTRERIEQRKEAGESDCALEVGFVSEAIVSFILSSISRWLKRGRKEQDNEFVRWMLISRAAMENPGIVDSDAGSQTMVLQAD
jgi:AcrR family transcriptional regulator